jgi:hypothetical protein
VSEQDAVPLARFEWERCVRRTSMAKELKLTAFVLASYADADGTRVKPSQATLSAVIGASDRSVRRYVRELRAAGFLTLVLRGGGRFAAGRPSEYRLSLPAGWLDRFEVLGPEEGNPPTDARRLRVVESEKDKPGPNSPASRPYERPPKWTVRQS